MRIVCAMSGGVDSSVAAALLVEAGHEVVGLTMRLYDASGHERQGRGGSCCSPAEIDQARDVCALLGIPHYTVDEQERFTAHVIDDFAREYARGRTPNPCVRCNEHVKFGPLVARARALGAEALATGHYARLEDGALLRAVDATKDQSYFLFAVPPALLSGVRFPLGTWHKDQVRAKARALGLPSADTPDSQELCFVGGRDHGEVVEARAAALGLGTAALAPGEVVDAEGRVLGAHGGIHRVTIGQRRGLRIPGTSPRYVLRVLPEQRQVVVGDAASLQTHALTLAEFRRLAPLGEREVVRAEVQIRHRGRPSAARVELAGDRATVVFDEPVQAAAPGQAAVVYAGERVLGGGWIAETAG
ncbi:tRNA 2-thiouridine(34) synthase MnmA [Nannocystis sp. ILAH1]|uniref:tRNA 2-thiouridine(34) synthase MnmA n=1 Tax=unclassified Nannocystis TaxID=2627009 RepID=UPI0022713E8F|nr:MULTISPECIES: tRNA 2-thiouridine(34) synthase MnmA [unclassified Nannocystis]MCY0985644.1 tRNA 2-thiouridine(34) synthase MnmA [Nannocystis sp. ILAH1]MCY1068330.1 tRNA 2-thiouridine(34) synthase MnmA [Nannocystis sp. RBIL2]